MATLPAHPFRGRWLALALTVLSPGCSHAATRVDSAPARVDDIPLQIANHNWLDITIYVLHDGQPTRLGIADATSNASFTLPSRLLGQGRELRLIGRPIGGTGAVITETIVVQPGQYVEWTLESDLNRSAIAVY
jgi:hypothetical protein